MKEGQGGVRLRGYSIAASALALRLMEDSLHLCISLYLSVPQWVEFTFTPVLEDTVVEDTSYCVELA